MSGLVAKARAALDGVTPGEWKFVPNGQKASVTDEDYDVLFRAVNNPNAYADARFIAFARSLVPDMADRIEALEAEAVEALEDIAKPRYGLQAVLEDGGSDDDIAHYYQSVCTQYHSIARATLARIKEAKNG